MPRRNVTVKKEGRFLFWLDDEEEEKKEDLRFDIVSNILLLGGSDG
jgi:hypothetical protein